VEDIRKLVDLGADVRAQNEQGRTALHQAAVHGHTEAVKVLVELGAHVRARDELGRMALDLAVDNGHTETVNVLEGMVASSFAQAQSVEDTVTPPLAQLLSAASEGRVEDIRKLVDLGADVRAQNEQGRTALHQAAVHGHTEAVKVLVELGAHVRARDELGRMALDLAVDNGHTETVNVLEGMVASSFAQAQEALPNVDTNPPDREHIASDSAETFPRPDQRNASKFSHLQAYSYAELAEATDRFSPQSKIGEGGFGTVYRGKLLGMPVAIKVLDSDSMQGQKELFSELEILGTISHRHIVNLYGWCPEEFCLVYELCEKGSLDDCLSQLRWHNRVRVATEVCRALLFLHKRKPEGVIHRDIKPSNVLLDHYWNVKLSDVGLGKILCSEGMRSIRNNHTGAMTSTMVGTFAYMDPEYLTSSKVSFSSDVYSLGMLLLQMITGLPARGDVTSRDVAEDAVAGNVVSLVDEAAGQWPLNHALAFTKLALRCAEVRRRGRPDLETEVLPALEKLYAECQSIEPTDGQHADRSVCVVCMDAPVTHAFLPCGHRCVCKQDAAALMARDMVCPMCRMRVIKAIRIY